MLISKTCCMALLLWCGYSTVQAQHLDSTKNKVQSHSSSAPIYFFIDGKITNSAQQPLKKAKVYIRSLSKEMITQKGNFALALPKGAYILNFSAADYVTKEVAIQLQRDTTLSIALMGMGGTHLLNEIEISTRSSTILSQKYSGLESIDKQIMEHIPTALGEKDIVKSLQLLPGINATADGSAEISVRGGTPDQNLLLFNQIPLYNASHLFGLISSFNPLIGDKVDLYKGNIPAKYGGKIASVLELRTIQPDTQKFHIDAELGILSAKAAIHIPILKSKSALLLAGRRTFLDWLANIGATRYQQSLFFNDFNLIYAHQINAKNKLLFTLYHDKDKFYLTNTEQSQYSAGGMTKVQNGGSLIWDSDFNPKVYNKAIAYYTQYNTQIEETKKSTSPQEANYTYTLGNQFKTIGFKDILNYQIHEQWQLSTGFELMKPTFEPSNFSNTEFGKTSTANYPTLDKVFTASAFAAVDYSFGSDWLLSTGVRNMYYRNAAYTYYSVEPRMGISKKINAWQFKAAFSRISQPTQRLYNTGLSMPIEIFFPSNANLSPQVGNQSSLGATYHHRWLGSDYHFSVEAYHKNLQSIYTFKDGYEVFNLIADNYFSSQDPNQGFDVLASGKGRIWGIESMIEKLNGRLTGWLNYSYMNAKEQYTALNMGLQFTSPQQKMHSANVFLYYQWSKKIGLSATWTFQSGMPITLPIAATAAVLPNPNGSLYTDEQTLIYQYNGRNRQTTIPYHRLDLNLKYSFKLRKQQAAFNFGIFNVYNRANPSFYFTKPSSNTHNPQVYSVSGLPILPSLSLEIKI